MLTAIFIIIPILILSFYTFKNISIFNYLIRLQNDIENSSQSIFLENAKNSYYKYKSANPYIEINIQSFVEETFASINLKNRSILNQIKSIKSSASQPILIGVLGTFVGLTVALVPLSKNTGEIVNSMSTVLRGMNVAFISSIVGIICSLILGIILKTKNCEHILLQIMLRVENIISAEASIQRGDLFRNNLDEVKSSIESITDSIKSLEKLDDTVTKMKEFNDTFAISVNKLDGALGKSSGYITSFIENIIKLEKQFFNLESKFSILFDYFEKQSELQNHIKESVSNSCEVISLTVVNQQNINKSLEEFIKDTNTSNKLAYNNLNSYFEHSNSLINELTSYQKDLHNSIENLCNNVEIHSKTVNQEIVKIDEILQDSINKTLSNFDNYVNLTNEIIDKKLDTIISYDRINKLLAYSSLEDEVNNSNDQ